MLIVQQLNEVSKEQEYQYSEESVEKNIYALIKHFSFQFKMKQSKFFCVSRVDWKRSNGPTFQWQDLC